MYISRVMVYLLIPLIIMGCKTQSSYEKGSIQNPITIYFTPSVNNGSLTKNSEHLASYLHQTTGLYFRTEVPTSYIAVVEAFGSARADIAVMNSFGYLLANKRYAAKAVFTTRRHGSTHYSGQIITRTDSGINSIEDLNGKKIAYTDSASLSGYILPGKSLADANVKPDQTVFAMKHDAVVTMVYQGQVDAGATFYAPPVQGKIRDARSLLLTQFPDIQEKTKIILNTQSIPNDPVVFSNALPAEISERVSQALISYISTPEGKSIFREMYGIEGFEWTRDEDFDALRVAIRSMAKEQKHLEGI